MKEQKIKRIIITKINLLEDNILKFNKFEKITSISFLQYNHLKLRGIALLFFLG